MAATGYNIQTTKDTISFRDQTTGVASIFYDHSTESLVISHDGTGALSFGDTASDVYIGDGVNSIDMIFEVDGAIKGDTDVTLTLGSTDSDVLIASPTVINNDLDITGTLDVTGSVGAHRFIQDGTVQSNFYAAGLSRSSSSLSVPDVYDTNGNGLVLGASNSEDTLVIETGHKVMIRGASDPDNNDGKADFAVGVGGDPMISWRNQQVQIGGTDMNWDGHIYHASSQFRMGAWASDIKLYTKASDSTVNDIIFETWNGSASIEPMRILGEGRVGIGTNNPGTKLSVYVSSPSDDAIDANNRLKIKGDGTLRWGNSADYGQLTWDTGKAIIRGLSGYALSLGANSSFDTLFINTSNNVGIGTTSPSSKLEVNGTLEISPTEPTINLNRSNGSYSWKIVNGAGGGNFPLSTFNIANNAGTPVITALDGGNVGINDTTPSYRLDVNGTLRATSAAYFNNDVSITNNLTLTGAHKPTFTTPDDTVYTPDVNWVTATPFNAAWHDLIAFDRNYTTTQEISTDGTNFSSDTLELGLFAQQDKTKYEVIGNGERAVRWTWTGVAYNVGEYFHIAAGYSSPAPTCTVKIETSADGSTWTEIHSSSGITFSATNRFYYVNPVIGNGGDNYVRLTIDKGNTDTKTVNLTSIKMLSQRLGDQGKGREDELPFYYDKNQNIGIGTASPASKLDINIALSNSNGITLDTNDEVYSIWSNSNLGGLAINADTVGATSRYDLFIKSNGNVGIGTNSPNYKLQVHGNVNVVGSGGYVRWNSGDMAIKNEGSYKLGFQTYNTTSASLTTKMVLDTDGNVGIGTTSPSSLLHMSGANAKLSIQASSGNPEIQFRDGSTDEFSVYYDTGSNYLSFTEDGVGSHMVIKDGGNVGIGTTSPAHKLDVDGGAKFNTNTGTTPFYVTRLGNTNEALSISVMDNTVRFESIQDETADDYGGFDFRLDAGTTHPNFTIRKGSANPILHVDGGGNVGIGTDNPDKKLVVSGTDSEIVINDTSYTPLLRFRNAGSTSGYILMNSSEHMQIHTGGTSEAVRIQANGNVGIGTTSPSTELDVAGDISADGVITTGGTATAEVGSWLHVGRQWSFSGLPYFNKTTGSTAQRLDGAFMTDLNTGTAASRRAQAVFGGAFNDISGYSGAGTDYSRALGASIKAGFFITGQNSAKVIFAVGLASTSGVYADADPISNYGFGVEFRRGSGSVYEWRVFGHNGTTLTASSWSSSGITYSTDPRTIAIYSDGSGNITAYTAMYGDTNYTTITTTGGPTATSGTSTSTNLVGLRCNTNASGYVTGAYAKARASAVNFYAE